MNAFRNLFRITKAGQLAALVTAGTRDEAASKYREADAGEGDITVEQVTHGYPTDICAIFA